MPAERVKISLDGREIEAPEGAPLVEVIKNSGTFISNLCYIDGRPPYAGCRTCLVEIDIDEQYIRAGRRCHTPPDWEVRLMGRSVHYHVALVIAWDTRHGMDRYTDSI